MDIDISLILGVLVVVLGLGCFYHFYYRKNEDKWNAKICDLNDKLKVALTKPEIRRIIEDWDKAHGTTYMSGIELFASDLDNACLDKKLTIPEFIHIGAALVKTIVRIIRTIGIEDLIGWKGIKI